MTFFSYMSVMVMRMPISSTSPNSSLADAPKYCMLEDNDMYALIRGGMVALMSKMLRFNILKSSEKELPVKMLLRAFGVGTVSSMFRRL